MTQEILVVGFGAVGAICKLPYSLLNTLSVSYFRSDAYSLHRTDKVRLTVVARGNYELIKGKYSAACRRI